LAHLALFFYGMALFIVGGQFFVMKIIRETTEIKVFFSNLIKYEEYGDLKATYFFLFQLEVDQIFFIKLASLLTKMEF
jgi:hypothetical protein